MTNPIYTFLPELLSKHRISDFHLHAGKDVTVRVHGELKQFENMLITEEDLQDLSNVNFQKTGTKDLWTQEILTLRL